jgi:hypothetical protein
MKIQSDDPGARRGALASSAADLRELRGNSRATVQELQTFLRELKGKSPQEMLGVVAASHLARSLVLSTGIVVGAILLFTAIPYFFGEKETQAPVEASAPPVTESPPPPPAPPETPQAVPQTDPLAPLGVGEQKVAPPDKNPLENQGDDFLKDLE